MGNSSKALVPVFLAGLLLITVSSSLMPLSRAQSSPAILPRAPPFIDLGAGPSSLAPARQGAPIFTINDSLWIYSTFDESITVALRNPANSSILIVNLAPSSIISLYTFTSSDPPGEWTLVFTLSNSTDFSMLVFLVEVPGNQVPVSLSEYSIQNGEINLGFSVNSPELYDLEGCLVSNASNPVDNNTISLDEPADVGTGQISVSMNSQNDTATFSTSRNVTTPFSFWFDLEYSYGYSAALTNETVSRDVVVARSDTALFNRSTSETVSLPILGNLRLGRYVVRGYFDSSSGLAVAQTTVLREAGGSWFWLSACNPFTVSGTSFSKRVNLAENPSTWPSKLYFMYQYDGIEGYSVLPLQINLARLDFLGQPGNVPLSGFTYSLSNSSDIEASGAYSGSVYVIAKNYPLSLTVTPMIGSEALNSVRVNITRPFSDSQIFIPIGKLTVEVTNNSKPDIGADVTISNSQGASLGSNIPAGGNTSFYLPSGLYNITVSKGGLAEEGNATVVDGSDTIVTITVTSPQFPRSYLELLLVPLVLGLALNIWAWVVSPRRTKNLLSR